MLLSEIDFESLEDVTSPDRWGADTHRDRRLFRDRHHYYKVWGDRFLETTRGAVGSEFKLIHGLRNVHGFEVGLFKPGLCRAFREPIRDAQGNVRGYVTRRGEHPDEIPDAFADLVFESALECGWLFSDLKEENVVIVDGVCSLIDYDTHLTCLEHFDTGFETMYGSLRPHVAPRYRDRILKALPFAVPVARRAQAGAGSLTA